MKRNPLDPFVRMTMAEPDVVALEALEAAFGGLYDAAMKVRELGGHGMAERLETIAEYVALETEYIATGMEEGGDIEIQGGEIEPSVEENLAVIYSEYIRLKSGKHSAYLSEADAVGAMRAALEEASFAGFHGSDKEIVAAAQDAYKAAMRHRGR
jgi:hypothetical protein